jgi:predicted glycoside hydrolase/deacetylase ChbG (UPF0249 family)
VNDKLNKSSFVVNADDLGLSTTATDGIFAAHRSGVVTSASMVVTTPATAPTVAQLADYPKLGIGLHFCLTAGRPVSAVDRVPDLVDAGGNFRLRFGSLLTAVSGPKRGRVLDQIAIELEAQVEKLHSFGIHPDHINGERHVHLIPGIIELVAAAAEKHHIPHVRLIRDIGLKYLSPIGIGTAVLTGGVVKVLLLDLLSRRALRKCRSLNGNTVRYATLLYTGRMHEVMPSIWARPPEGITEIAVHPGAPAPEYRDSGTANEALSRYLSSPDRRAEMEACIALNGIDTAARLCRFKDIYSSA